MTKYTTNGTKIIDESGNVCADLNEAVRVYNGVADACMCGCKGTYVDAGTRAAKMRINKILKIISTDSEAKVDISNEWQSYVYVVASGSNRCFCAYMP
jgi:hypothetical protein